MNNIDLKQIEFSDLSSSFRAIDVALDRLNTVEDGLISDETINQIRECYVRIEEELRRRGYSAEEIADMTETKRA